MNEFMKLYASGLQYKDYIGTADASDKEKHLHYMYKMELNDEEKKQVMAIKPVSLLVFCNINCNDCRIALAVLESIRLVNPNLHFRIAGREENKALMQTIDKNCRIPMIIKVREYECSFIFNEIPEAFRERTEKLEPELIQSERLKYRKGLYKDEILRQIVDSLS